MNNELGFYHCQVNDGVVKKVLEGPIQMTFEAFHPQTDIVCTLCDMLRAVRLPTHELVGTKGRL